MTRELWKKMTYDEKRIVVAKLRGWKHEGGGYWLSPGGESYQALYPYGGHQEGVIGMGKYDEEIPPDFPNDLNDCNEFEINMSGEEYYRFWRQLVAICVEDGIGRIHSAPASARCEAFALIMSTPTKSNKQLT